MKKLLYIVPLLLLVLSAASIVLYKDDVDLAINKGATVESGVFEALSPRHWKVINLSVTGSSEPTDAYVFEGSDEEFQKHLKQEMNPTESLSERAKFYGFPIAAYFSTNTPSTSASGFSWLWLAVDAGLVLGSLWLAVKFNRAKTK